MYNLIVNDTTSFLVAIDQSIVHVKIHGNTVFITYRQGATANLVCPSPDDAQAVLNTIERLLLAIKVDVHTQPQPKGV